MERKLKSRRSKILSQQKTSLASPTEPTPTSYMTRMPSDEKNFVAGRNRVQLGVSNGVSNGGVNSKHSFRILQRVPSSTKGNGSNLGNLSSKSTQPWKMSVKQAMSPTASMDRSGPSIHLQRSPISFDRNHLRIVGAPADWPDDLNLQYRSAVSEMSRSAPTRASAHRSGKYRTNSFTPRSVRTSNLSGSISAVRFTNRQPVKTMKNQAQQSAKKPPEMTIEKAVELLDKINEEEQISAAAYIQSQCFGKDEAKDQVCCAHGAKKLVELLKSDSEEVQRAAAAALRNVIYNNENNKKEVSDENGLTTTLNLLAKTHDKETVCQLAGVLWNLSSVDAIKDLFNEHFLDALTKVILVPFSRTNGEAESKRDLIADPNAFLCATACLRNLSSDYNHARNMRSCENLIDSLAFYTTEVATKCTPDDKLTENCVCILQNLTYKAEEDWNLQKTENTEGTQQNTTPKETNARDVLVQEKCPSTTCSCFPYRRANLGEDAKDKEEAEMTCLLQNNEDPIGVKWLWSGQLVRAYLSLLACSTNKMTLQAAMGALQNLTVGKKEISESAARIIKEEKGPWKIMTVLENNMTLMKPALFLTRNLSRFPELHSSIFDDLVATKTTKSLLYLLDISAEESAELMPILCRILINLSKNNVQLSMRLRHEMAVNDMLQKKYEGKAKKAVKELRDSLSYRSLHKCLKVGPFTHHSISNVTTNCRSLCRKNNFKGCCVQNKDKTKNAKILNNCYQSLCSAVMELNMRTSCPQ